MNKSTLFTTIWIALVSIFLLTVLDTKFQSDGTPKYIRNNANGIVIKSESRNKVKYKIEDGKGNFLYSWTFLKDRNNKEDIEKEVDFIIQTDVINPKINKITDTTDKMIITFDHHGNLPSKSEIELNVSEQFNDGDKLYLYYFNDDKSRIEFKQDNIVVKNGLADFNIDHCSEYILSKTKIEESINNPSVYLTYLYYFGIGLLILFVVRKVLFKGSR